MSERREERRKRWRRGEKERDRGMGGCTEIQLRVLARGEEKDKGGGEGRVEGEKK